MIILQPIGGLCNRLQAIASYDKFCREAKRKLVVIWLINDELNCPLRRLFAFPKEITLIEINCYRISGKILRGLLSLLLRGLTHIDHKKSLPLIDAPMDSEQMKVLKKRMVHCEVCEPLSYQMQCDIFEPMPEIVRRREEVLCEKRPYIALHIRRGDFVEIYGEEFAKKSDARFAQVIEREMTEGNYQHAFLATDDEALKNALLQKYASFIFTQKTTSLQRNQTTGMMESCVDLMCLAGAEKIYGSSNSSFSRVASQMMGAELILPQE